MKPQHLLLLAGVALTLPVMQSSAEIKSDAGVTITSLPYTVTASREYIIKSDLTAPSGDNGITIASGVNNVAINLNGHMLFGSGGTGLICSNSTNVTVKSGVISGFSNGISFDGSEFFLNSLKVIVSATGVSLTGVNCTIDSCVIVSTTPDTLESGIAMNCNQSQVRNCQVSGFNVGINEGGGYNTMIYNFLTNCTTGLLLVSSDKYQGNTATRCGTNFSGGTAVGQENG
jgi:hypothetical protein